MFSLDLRFPIKLFSVRKLLPCRANREQGSNKVSTDKIRGIPVPRVYNVDGLGSIRFTVGLDNLKSLFQLT